MKTETSNHGVTNAQIVFNILVAARDAEHALTRLRDDYENLYGEKHPVTEKLNNILEDLDASQLLYNLGYNEMDYLREDGPDPAPFLQWLSDPRGYGLCKDCTHRLPPDDNYPHFTRCRLHGGYFADNYGCHDFKPSNTTEQ